MLLLITIIGGESGDWRACGESIFTDGVMEKLRRECVRGEER